MHIKICILSFDKQDKSLIQNIFIGLAASKSKFIILFI